MDRHGCARDGEGGVGMTSFTGRPSTGRVKAFGKGLIEGLGALSTAMVDSPKRERIREIDFEIEKLQYEKDCLITSMIEPGDLEVSKGFDPNNAVIMNPPTKPGRLTDCAGRDSYSLVHNAHPACPYVKQIHVAHQFTAHD